MKKPLLSAFLFLLATGLLAQGSPENTPSRWQHRLQLEAGFSFPSGSISENLAIRQNISSYYVYQSSQGSVYCDLSSFNTALKWGMYNPALKLGFAAGMRYSTFNTLISGYTSNNANFFYIRYSTSGTDTKFARIKSISESSKLIGIPIEATYFPFSTCYLQCFLKAGIEPASFRISHLTDIEFENPDMEAVEEEVAATFNTPVSTFCSTFYTSVGFTIAGETKPGFTFEWVLPSVFISQKNFNLADVNRAFTGIRASMHIPVR
ncbi:MAG TPA: hypothetical protein P5338_11115 [Bacteroidales bacterium]|nr:hypothetical protein [Bacteroidales bacterium]